MRAAWILATALLVTAGAPVTAEAADQTCPRAGTLGVSRTVEIDTTGAPGFGMQHYKAYDFLQPKEVVLTFDDGPQLYSTESVLKALADECVKATFFSIGKMALGYPEIIREVAKAGHTVGTHTWSHKAISKLKTFDEGRDEIERGFSAVKRAVGGPIAPFFRFPTLKDTPEAVAYLGKRNIAMFSTDIDSFDFKPQTADHIVKTVMQKLDKAGKGILLMHDIHKTTAKALPMLLAELKAKGYKIVHLQPKFPVETLPEFDSAIEKDAKGLPQVGAERPLSSIVKTIEVAPDGGAPAAPSGDAEAAPAAKPAAVPVAPPAAPAVVPAPTPSAPAVVAPGSTAADAPKPSPPPVASPATSPPAAKGPGPQTSAEPAARAPVTTAVVATVPAHETGDEAEPEGLPPEKSAAAVGGDPAPAEPHRSVSQRAKDVWELWFGK